MGYVIMKEAPNVDFYVEWSSIVDGPTRAGTRAEMLDHLRQGSDPWLRDDAPHHPEQRMRRADETGTSSLWVKSEGLDYPEDGAWDDPERIYQQDGTVTRADVFVLTRRLLADPDADVSDLLTPFDDEDNA